MRIFNIVLAFDVVWSNLNGVLGSYPRESKTGFIITTKIASDCRVSEMFGSVLESKLEIRRENSAMLLGGKGLKAGILNKIFRSFTLTSHLEQLQGSVVFANRTASQSSTSLTFCTSRERARTFRNIALAYRNGTRLEALRNRLCFVEAAHVLLIA